MIVISEFEIGMNAESTKIYKHILEIGAGDMGSSLGLCWHNRADKITLYEPNVILYHSLSDATSGLLNVKVFNQAVSDVNEEHLLVYLGYASYLLGTASFVKLSIDEEGEKWLIPLTRVVKTVSIRDIDLGDVEVLILTSNGCDFSILTSMISRPRIVFTKHYVHNRVQADEATKVCNWLVRHGYRSYIIDSNQYETFLSIKWVKEMDRV